MAVLRSMGITCGAVADLDFGYTHARSGRHAWLDKNNEDMARVKAVLQRLQPQHDFEIGGNGLPTNNGIVSAAAAWSLFAADDEGAALANEVHTALKEHCLWAWPVGCIEDILGEEDKGEEAIQRQEDRLRAFTPADVVAEMPMARDCLDWIAGL
jgi:hypothetical protein